MSSKKIYEGISFMKNPDRRLAINPERMEYDSFWELSNPILDKMTKDDRKRYLKSVQLENRGGFAGDKSMMLGKATCSGPMYYGIKPEDKTLLTNEGRIRMSVPNNGNKDVTISDFKIWMYFLRRMGIVVDYKIGSDSCQQYDVCIDYFLPLKHEFFGDMTITVQRLPLLLLHTFVRYIYNKMYCSIAMTAIKLKIDNPHYTEWKCLELAHLSCASTFGKYSGGYGLISANITINKANLAGTLIRTNQYGIAITMPTFNPIYILEVVKDTFKAGQTANPNYNVNSLCSFSIPFDRTKTKETREVLTKFTDEDMEGCYTSLKNSIPQTDAYKLEKSKRLIK